MDAIGLGVILGVIGVCLWAIISTLMVLIKYLRRRPRFHMTTMFAILAVFSVTFGILKVVGVSGHFIVNGFLAMCSFIWAVGIVCGILLMLEERSRAPRVYPSIPEHLVLPLEPSDSATDADQDSSSDRSCERLQEELAANARPQ